jgi:hypothetical protein
MSDKLTEEQKQKAIANWKKMTEQSSYKYWTKIHVKKEEDA